MTRTDESVQEENVRLRAALSMSQSPCVYCSLSREDWSKCRSGFPGCDRAYDAMGCPELGAALQVMKLENLLRRSFPSIIFHYLACVDDDKTSRSTKKMHRLVKSYNGLFPEKQDQILNLVKDKLIKERRRQLKAKIGLVRSPTEDV